MVVYVDGSCKPNRVGGWAFLSLMKEDQTYEKIGRLENTTCNRTELYALLQAIKYIGKRTALIYTDSKVVSNGVNEDMFLWESRDWKTTSGRSIVNSDLWKSVKELLDKNSNVKVIWTSFKNKRSSHYEYHKRVDKLSKMASNMKEEE